MLYYVANEARERQLHNLKKTMKTETKYTQEEAYELSLRWMPRINKNLATQWEIENLASKIWSGEVTIADLEKIKLIKQ